MKASEVKVNDSFIASVWLSDWREHREKGCRMPTEMLSVSIVLPGCDTDFAKTMLKVHASLAIDDPAQIDGRQCLWVAGYRDKRSKTARIIDWATPNAGGQQ